MLLGPIVEPSFRTSFFTPRSFHAELYHVVSTEMTALYGNNKSLKRYINLWIRSTTLRPILPDSKAPQLPLIAILFVSDDC